MSEKLLTISIAAYNVAQYIEQALDSCLIEKRDLLDVIVVDDGATDSTVSLVEPYVEKYPETFRLIRKENGGYGSTVNASLREAQGKYFKLLDGDDWFDFDGLTQLVDVLETSDVDLCVTPYLNCYADGQTKKNDQAEPVAEGVHKFNEARIPWRISMHSMTYATRILCESGLQLTHHRLYTDTEFINMPLHLVQTVHIMHTPVYCYRLGRDGQSMSVESLIKNRGDWLAVTQKMIEHFAERDVRWGTAAHVNLAWIIDDSIGYMKTLFSMPTSADVWEEIESFLNYLRSYEDIYRLAVARSKWMQLFATTNQYTYPVIARIFVSGRKLLKKLR
ncbi:MAG: glycosyltransferase family 2 protein [Actinomycetaceae bacterium]|nr:glycosyltransferase family 2 protein [Actinomycetaceae bacterium]